MDIVLFIAYILCGAKAIKYVKANIFGIVAEYTNNLANLILKNILFGFLFGWLAIPVALIHWIFIGRNRA